MAVVLKQLKEQIKKLEERDRRKEIALMQPPLLSQVSVSPPMQTESAVDAGVSNSRDEHHISTMTDNRSLVEQLNAMHTIESNHQREES